MAIALDTTGYGANSNTTTLSFSHTCSWTNRILIVWFYTWDGTNNISSVTYWGTAMTLWASCVLSNYLYIYYLINPPTWANTVLVTKGNPQWIEGFSISYTGASQVWINVTWTNTASSNTLTVSATTTVPNCWVTWVFADTTGYLIGAWSWTTLRWQARAVYWVMVWDSNWPVSQWSTSLACTAWSTNLRWAIIAFAPAPSVNTNFHFF